jgi:hypothetical protein
MQVNFLPPSTWVVPTFMQVAPAATFGAAIASGAKSNSVVTNKARIFFIPKA